MTRMASGVRSAPPASSEEFYTCYSDLVHAWVRFGPMRVSLGPWSPFGFQLCAAAFMDSETVPSCIYIKLSDVMYMHVGCLERCSYLHVHDMDRCALFSNGHCFDLYECEDSLWNDSQGKRRVERAARL